jgi:hypothetical protein
MHSVYEAVWELAQDEAYESLPGLGTGGDATSDVYWKVYDTVTHIVDHMVQIPVSEHIYEGDPDA